MEGLGVGFHPCKATACCPYGCCLEGERAEKPEPTPTPSQEVGVLREPQVCPAHPAAPIPHPVPPNHGGSWQGPVATRALRG